MTGNEKCFCHLNGLVVKDARARKQLEVYTTPEMFGAVGDGVADDTMAIVSALSTGKPVVLEKEYRIETITVPMGADIIVNGTLIVNGTINICYPNITFSGSGTIKCIGDVCFTLKGAGNTETTYCKDFHISSGLAVEGVWNKDNTAFLITADEGKNGIVVYPEINCIIRTFKYGIHSLYSGNDKAWFTSLRCRSLIENCQYAIIFDWHGNGSVFNGVIQPLVSDNPGADDIPLVKIKNNCTINGMVWDMHTAPNKYAVVVDGNANSVDVALDDRYIKCAELAENNIKSRINQVFPVSNALYEGYKNGVRPKFLPYDNTNDLARNAGNNKVGFSVTPSAVAYHAKRLLSGTDLSWYVARETAPDGIVMEFAFPNAVALREIYVSGERLPADVSFEYKDASGEWVHLKTCVGDEDYAIAHAGSNSFAWWQYTYSSAIPFAKKFAYGVRITMHIDTTFLLSQIYIGAVDITMPTKFGDDLIATTFKIKGSDGKYYDISVQNGALVATAET